MINRKERGFTVIELITVSVIVTVLALIIVPIVMNIIRKAEEAADRNSVKAYAHSIEQAVASYLLDNGKFPKAYSTLLYFTLSPTTYD